MHLLFNDFKGYSGFDVEGWMPAGEVIILTNLDFKDRMLITLISPDRKLLALVDPKEKEVLEVMIIETKEFVYIHPTIKKEGSMLLPKLR